MNGETIRPVRARWQVCQVCASTDVLVVVKHVGPILCYECVVDGYRYEPGDFEEVAR